MKNKYTSKKQAKCIIKGFELLLQGVGERIDINEAEVFRASL